MDYQPKHTWLSTWGIEDQELLEEIKKRQTYFIPTSAPNEEKLLEQLHEFAWQRRIHEEYQDVVLANQKLMYELFEKYNRWPKCPECGRNLMIKEGDCPVHGWVVR